MLLGGSVQAWRDEGGVVSLVRLLVVVGQGLRVLVVLLRGWQLVHRNLPRLLRSTISTTIIVSKSGKIIRCLNLNTKNIQFIGLGPTIIVMPLIPAIIWRSLVFVLDYLCLVRVDVGVWIQALRV